MIQVRNCTSSDRDFLVQLVLQDSDPIPGFLGISPSDIARGTEKVFRFPAWWVMTLTRWLRVPLARLLVAEYAGKPVGFVSVGFQQGHGLIGTLITDASHRRLGIGSALMNAAEAAVCARGYQIAVLEVNQANEGARCLYQRLGYRVLFVNRWFEGALSGTPVRTSDGPCTARTATQGDIRHVRALRKRSLPPSLVKVLSRPDEDPASIDEFARSQRGERHAWCIGPPGAPSGLVRGYTSSQGGLSFLSCPRLDSSTSPAQQNVLVETALDWLRSKKTTRAITALPSYSAEAVAAVRRAGLVERLQSEFMFRELR